MSVEQMAQVWKLDLAPNKRLVLLAYADHANDEGGDVFPSLARVAHKTGYSRDQVRRITRELAEDDLMQKVAEADPNGRGAEYRLTLERGSKLPPLKPRGGGSTRATRGVANDPGGVGAPMQPEPPERTANEPPESTSLNANAFKAGEQPGQGQADTPAPAKPISSKQYAVRRLAEKVKRAKEEKKNPTPPDENFKRRFASVYEAYLRDGYEPWQLEKPMDYMVACACGQGVGWLQGKRRWIPLVDAIAHVEGDDRATTNETPNPASDAAIAARDKPRAPLWYTAMFERANFAQLEKLIGAGYTHTQIVEELEKGESGAA